MSETIKPSSDETVREDPVVQPCEDSEVALVVTLVGPTSEHREWRFAKSDKIFIGRGVDSNLRIDDRSISRHHATVVHLDDGWTYRHYGTNTSLLDGRPVTTARLSHGTVIHLHSKGPRLRFEPGPLADEGPEKSSKPITAWVEELAAGDSQAATHLWDAYFERIARLAKLRLKPSLRRVSDEEDVAASVFASLCDGIAQGRFPELASRDNLWQLLATMTARKAIDVANRAQRQKRGGGNVRGESIFLAADGEFGFEQLVAVADSPDFEAQLVEEVQERLDVLADADLRRIAQLRLEGYTVEEIAVELGCNPRTVQRRLQNIREKWSPEEGPPTEAEDA